MLLKIIFLLILHIFYVLSSVPEEQFCHSYAGGSVYPLGLSPQQTDHKLQWTKAVSKLQIIITC